MRLLSPNAHILLLSLGLALSGCQVAALSSGELPPPAPENNELDPEQQTDSGILQEAMRQHQDPDDELPGFFRGLRFSKNGVSKNGQRGRADTANSGAAGLIGGRRLDRESVNGEFRIKRSKKVSQRRLAAAAHRAHGKRYKLRKQITSWQRGSYGEPLPSRFRVRGVDPEVNEDRKRAEKGFRPKPKIDIDGPEEQQAESPKQPEIKEQHIPITHH